MEEYVISEKRQQNLLMFIVAVSVVMFSIDYSMVNISLPDIARYFNAKLATVTWIPLMYLLMVTSLLLGFGKLGDIKGYKKVFLLGLLFFIAGTILCGVAPSIKILIMARTIQSVGEAMFSPMGLALITTFLPFDIRGKALGVIALSQGVGFTLGPLIGGFLTASVGWRSIFFINVPIGIAMFFLAMKMLPSKQRESSDRRFDLPGSVSIFIALSTLLFALNSGAKLGWANKVILACFGISAVAFLIFILQEKKVSYPLLDLNLLKNKDFTFAGISVFLAVCSFFGLYLLLPFYFEIVLRLKMTQAGVLLMIAPLMMMVLAPFSGKASDRMGSRILCSVGMAMTLIGFIASSFLTKDTKPVVPALILFIFGSAMGIFMAPNNKLIMAHAPIDKQGVASGVYKMMLGIGGVLGIAIFPAVVMQTLASVAVSKNIPMMEVRNHPDIMMMGFRNVFLFGVLMASMALFFSVLAKDKKQVEKE